MSGKTRETYDTGYRMRVRRQNKLPGVQTTLWSQARSSPGPRGNAIPSAIRGAINEFAGNAIQNVSMSAIFSVLASLNPLIAPLYYIYKYKEVIATFISAVLTKDATAANKKMATLQTLILQGAKREVIEIASAESAQTISDTIKDAGVYKKISETINGGITGIVSETLIEQIFMQVAPSVLEKVTEGAMEVVS